MFDSESWDADVRKSWGEFVKRSKVNQSKQWDSNDVDEGLPQIFVDLNRE